MAVFQEEYTSLPSQVPQHAAIKTAAVHLKGMDHLNRAGKLEGLSYLNWTEDEGSALLPCILLRVACLT